MIYETKIELIGGFETWPSNTNKRTEDWLISCVKQEYIKYIKVGDTVCCKMTIHKKGYCDEDLSDCVIVAGRVEEINNYLCTTIEGRDKYVQHVLISPDTNDTKEIISVMSKIEDKIKDKYPNRENGANN